MLTTEEILKKVRELEIKSKKLTRHIFTGEYHSAFKGRGMHFKEVREYHHGDDIRFIDWNVSARFGHPYSKIFEEERELTVDGLPPRVQAEVRRLSAGGLIDEIKEERQGAEVKYEVEIIRGEKKLEYEFAADGSLLEQKTKKR